MLSLDTLDDLQDLILELVCRLPAGYATPATSAATSTARAIPALFTSSAATATSFLPQPKHFHSQPNPGSMTISAPYFHLLPSTAETAIHLHHQSNISFISSIQHQLDATHVTSAPATAAATSTAELAASTFIQQSPPPYFNHRNSSSHSTARASSAPPPIRSSYR